MPPFQSSIPSSEMPKSSHKDSTDPMFNVNSLTESFVEKLRFILAEETKAKLEKEKTLLLQDLERERDQVKNALEELEGEKAKLRGKLVELRKARENRMNEKKKMKALGIGLNDVLELNVGGEMMSVKRSTLCQVEGSLLSSMFSGRWEENLERDAQGRIFLDFNPQCFAALIDAFRSMRMASPGQVIKLSGMDPDLYHYFTALVDYMGLTSIIFSDDEPEFYIGKRIEVYWSRYQHYYPGIISSYCSKTETHKVNYADGDVQSYNLAVHDWRFTKTYIHWIRKSN